MITGAEGRQSHTLLDIKKQQWAKEKGGYERMCVKWSDVWKLKKTTFGFSGVLELFSELISF